MGTRKPKYVAHRDVLAREMKDPEFRFHYEQRKFVQEIALTVRSLRKGQGLTQEALAKTVGVSQPMIAKIEKGIDQSQPNWQLLHRIVAALGIQMKLTLTSKQRESRALVEVDGRPATEQGHESPRPKGGRSRRSKVGRGSHESPIAHG